MSLTIEQIRAKTRGSNDVENHSVSSRPKSSRSTRRRGARTNGFGVGADLVASTPTADANLIAAGCKQFAEFVGTNGNQSYEVWRSCVGLCRFTRQGEEFAQQHSNGYPTYSRAETHDKFHNWQGGPPRCDHFEAVNSAGCNGCLHRGVIVTPVSLGYASAGDHNGAAIQNDLFGHHVNGHAVLDGYPDLPDGFRWRPGDNALCQWVPNERGDGTFNVISVHPIYLERIQRGETKGEIGLVFNQHHPHRGWYEVAIDYGNLRGAGGVARLCRLGPNPSDAGLFLEYVRCEYDRIVSRRPDGMTYEQFGWKDDCKAFLYGDYLYTANGEEKVTVTPDLANKSKWVGPVAGGSLEKWREAASGLFSSGFEGQGATLLAGFGSPLMRFASPTESGAIWSNVTPTSGTGKTTSALGAISIYGAQRGLEIKPEYSHVARGITMGMCAALPVMCDELRARDPIVIRDFVMWFTSGRDKPRGLPEGGLRETEHLWQNILITTDNTSLVDTLAQDNDVEDAAQMRVIELPCSIPPGRSHVWGDQMKRQLLENAGWAGDAYIARLVELGPEKLKDQMDKACAAIEQKTGWDQRYRFWTRTIAACFVGGLIAKQLRLIDFDLNRIINWLIDQLQERVRQKTSNWEVPLLASFLDHHGNERLIVQNKFIPGQRFASGWIEPKSGKLSVRYEQERRIYWIAGPILRAWVIKQGQSYSAMLKRLIELKVVTARQKRITLGAGTPYASGQVWAVEVDASHPLMSGVPRLEAEVDAGDEAVPAQLSDA